MYNEKTEKSLFCGTFAAKQQKVQHKILTSEYTYFSRREKWNSIAYICENPDRTLKPKITEKRKRSQGTKKSCSSLQKERVQRHSDIPRSRFRRNDCRSPCHATTTVRGRARYMEWRFSR